MVCVSAVLYILLTLLPPFTGNNGLDNEDAVVDVDRKVVAVGVVAVFTIMGVLGCWMAFAVAFAIIVAKVVVVADDAITTMSSICLTLNGLPSSIIIINK